MLLFYGWAGFSSSESIDVLIRLKTGFLSGILASVRWAIFIGFCFLLTMTTTPSDLTWALQVLLNPLHKIRFPVHDLSVMAGLALHFLPLLKEEADRLIKVKKIRGTAFDSGTFTEKLHNIIGLIPILIKRIIRRSEVISMAMEARGYSYKNTNAQEIMGFCEPLSKKDYSALAVLTVYLIIIWFISRFFIASKI
jgi:energy-coupling factor transport system permease protein